jgi:integrase
MMVEKVSRRWYLLRCIECGGKNLSESRTETNRFDCRDCGKTVKKNKEAYSKWKIPYRDGKNKRRQETGQLGWSKKQADDRQAELRKYPGGDPYVKFSTIAEKWINHCEMKVKTEKLRPQSLEDYRRKVRHATEEFGHLKIKSIDTPMVLDFLVKKINDGLGARTVSEIRGRLTAVFNYAVAHRYRPDNPMIGITKDLLLTPASSTEDVRDRAFSKEQREIFLNVAPKENPEVYPLLFALDRTGMRIGEACALKPEDVDLEKRDLNIGRTWVRGGVLQEKPKSKAGFRTIDMSIELCNMIRKVTKDRIAPWLFMCGDRHWTPSMVNKRIKRILKAAKLPKHFSAHSFRHTYATRALEKGCSLEWLRRQLGHEDLRITDKLYGGSARISDKAQADRLDNGHATRQGRLEGM